MSPERPVPANWIGGLNISYSIGPGFKDPSWKLKLEVSTANINKTIYNVIATIEGSEEPGTSFPCVEKELFLF